MTSPGARLLGLIVNPIAGIGGRVGLKGSDTDAIREKALALGAKPLSTGRAARALDELRRHDANFHLLTCPGAMGSDSAKMADLPHDVLDLTITETTCAADTRMAAEKLRDQGADLILFAGGDGTARDIHDAIGATTPVLGIPAGVKIHSPVYATTPESAGRAAAHFLSSLSPQAREAEVMDLDEDAIREEDSVRTQLYGYLTIPAAPGLTQEAKQASAGDENDLRLFKAIAKDVIELMEPGVTYIIGPGTTTRAIMQQLRLDCTLIGIDAVRDGKLIARDANEKKLKALIKQGPVKIVVTPIGGQGYLFGRGNQQISPDIIRAVGKENIIVVAASAKIDALRGKPLLVDTGDADLDRDLRGYISIRDGSGSRRIYKIA